MTKTIEIDGKAVTFRATAAIPRLYRIKFGRDILQAMTALKSAMEAAERGEGYIGDENKTNNKQYEYPYLMQTKDGMIHLAYAAWTRDAMKYVRFTEEDVLGEKRERVGLYNPTAAQGCK